MARILVVDDDREWTSTLTTLLEHAGHEVETAYDGSECLRKCSMFAPELITLDIGMPLMDGFDVIRRLRPHSTVLVLGLSVHGNVEQKILDALHLGFDAIIPKSSGVDEIRARVDALLRRGTGTDLPRMELLYNDGILEIDLDSGTTIRKRGENISLTSTELKLFRVLLERRSEIIPHNELLVDVWGPDYEGQRAYLAVYMRYLRNKIEDDASHPQYLVTRHRLGYGFVPGPHPSPADDEPNDPNAH